VPNNTQLLDVDLPLVVTDYSILNHYKENLYSEETNVPIKLFTLNAIKKSVISGHCYIALPSSHYRALDQMMKGGSYLELSTFLNLCTIYPESSTEFEFAPILTASLLDSAYPKRKIYVLTLNAKTAATAKELGFNVIGIDEALKLLA
jgi:hypothetical protein